MPPLTEIPRLLCSQALNPMMTLAMAHHASCHFRWPILSCTWKIHCCGLGMMHETASPCLEVPYLINSSPAPDARVRPHPHLQLKRLLHSKCTLRSAPPTNAGTLKAPSFPITTTAAALPARTNVNTQNPHSSHFYSVSLQQVRNCNK